MLKVKMIITSKKYMVVPSKKIKMVNLASHLPCLFYLID
jgi:hypothetical protein